MAGAGYRLFNTGDVLTAAQVNTFLQEQVVMVFANATARTTALSGVLAEGMMSYLQDTNAVEVYNGSAWVSVGSTGDITGVTAGTGISGGGTSGDVTITNSMATAINAKADLIVGTANDSFDRLAVGSNGDTLVADSSATTGLRWTSVGLGNPVINGGMDIWQRGTSFTSFGTTSTFTADRYYAYRGDLSSTITVSRQSSGFTGIQYSTRVQRNSGNTSTSAINFIQDIESVNSIPFAGKTITFSFYAKAGANYSAASSNLTFAVISGTGTDQRIAAGYTGSATLINTTATLTTSWQRFTATATVGTTATQLGFYFEFVPVGTAGANDWYEVTGIQIDVGSVALPFRRAGGTLAGELAACQRYYFRIERDGSGSAGRVYPLGVAASTSAAQVTIPFTAKMRTSPTSITFANLRAFDGANFVTLTNVTFADASTSYGIIEMTSSAAFTQYRPYWPANNGDGFIAFSAEL